MKQESIALILAILTGIGSYIAFTIQNSMCYYSGTGLPGPISYELIEAIRNKCSDKFSLVNIIPEIIIVFVIAFLAIYGLLQLVSKWRRK